MEELLEILQDIDDSVDYENETALIDDHILDSFGINIPRKCFKISEVKQLKAKMKMSV